MVMVASPAVLLVYETQHARNVYGPIVERRILPRCLVVEHKVLLLGDDGDGDAGAVQWGDKLSAVVLVGGGGLLMTEQVQCQFAQCLIKWLGGVAQAMRSTLPRYALCVSALHHHNVTERALIPTTVSGVVPYEHVFTRLFEDVRGLQQVFGSDHAHYIPDLVWGQGPFPRTSDNGGGSSAAATSTSLQQQHRISVFVSGQHISGVITMLMAFLHSELSASPRLGTSVAAAARTLIDVKLYCETADEAVAVEKAMGARTTGVTRYSVAVFDGASQNDWHDLAASDIAICEWYHGHVYAMLAGVPVMSICTNRDTKSLMTRAHMQMYQYDVPPSSSSSSTAATSLAYEKMSGEKMRQIYRRVLTERAQNGSMSYQFVNKCRALLQSTSAQFEALIFYSCSGGGAAAGAAVGDVNDDQMFVAKLGTIARSAGGLPHHVVAQLVSEYATRGMADSPYVWGITQKLDGLGSGADVHVWEQVVRYAISFIRRDRDHSAAAAATPADVSVTTAASAVGGGSGGVRRSVVASATPGAGGIKYPLWVDVGQYESFRNVHRGGWHAACVQTSLTQQTNKVTRRPNGLIMDMYVDRTFHWMRDLLVHRGVLPYTSPWMGVLHHTMSGGVEMNSVSVLFGFGPGLGNGASNETSRVFLQSLHMCRGLVTLSEPLSAAVRDMLRAVGCSHIPVCTLVHPVSLDDIAMQFTPERWARNPSQMVVQVGAWMRDPTTLYHATTTTGGTIKRAVLMGPNMDATAMTPWFNLRLEVVAAPVSAVGSPSPPVVGGVAVPPQPCRSGGGSNPPWLDSLVRAISKYYDAGAWLNSYDAAGAVARIGVSSSSTTAEVEAAVQRVNGAIGTTLVLPQHDNRAYDTLLSQNVVFLDLVDAAAVNTIIECIVRGTPVLVNRCVGTEALLGRRYPMFYELKRGGATTIDLAHYTSPRMILETHNYLRRIDRKRYAVGTFVEQLGKFALSVLTGSASTRG